MSKSIIIVKQKSCEDWRDKIERHYGECIFHGSRKEWIVNYDPYEWELSTGKKMIKGEYFQLWWSSRAGGMWVRK